jgi:uncharacterized membrane protein YeaQ/YmgE (transglycosylase-associated protein family)
LFFALIGYFTEIQGAIHVMWAALLFDLIAGLANSMITKKERFSMPKFFVAIVRAIGASVLVAILYAMDKEMNQKIAASYNIAAWLISGFYVWSASENMDQLTGGRIFGILKGFLGKKIEKDTGIDLNDDTMKNVVKTLIVALLLLVGCKSSSKLTESTVTTSNERTEVNTSVVEKKDLAVQKAVSTDMETTTEETITEFYAPASTSSPTGSVTGYVDKGPVKAIRILKTTTKKKDADNSTITDKGQNQENTQQKKEGETETKSQKSEVKSQKFGLAWWKIGIGIGLALVVLYFLVKKNIIHVPFLTNLLKWLKL